jgi:crossover junction endodeoxyribonuclease RuvC
MFVLGVDIGNTGAVALIDESGELLEVCDMPCLDDGPKGRPSVNAPLLAAIVARAGATQAYVEWVGPRPTDGAVQAFAFGRCKGVLEGVLAAGGVPVTFLTPPQWKRLVGIAPGRAGAKDAARSEAIRRWPGQAAFFARVKDDGRAEAALIAVAGLKREGERDHGHFSAGQAAPRAIGAS